ncbi:hypothetical protein EVAR_77310_1 [Eumeta japonica]|uniref:Uncharacterized protein n=1 Tax=Eumeta variegata TaxID=151549 RepID=A0A4C1UMS6_EUMVA|nr:hypothetical protein EVAR_77310_1 [Eumeta japonica]
MPSKIKVHAGLQPILRGPGKSLHISPEDMLKGNVVLTPVKPEDVSSLGCSGIQMIQNKFLKSHQKTLETKKQAALDESDKKWLEIVKTICADNFKECSEKAKINNSIRLREAIRQFEVLYISSINKLEETLNAAPAEKIELLKEQIYNDKVSEYEKLVKQQATALYDKYETKLKEQKTLSRKYFIEGVENKRTEIATRIHDINLEKHRTVDKLRKLIEYQNLACQVYVMLKERKYSKAESGEMRYVHGKVTAKLTKELHQKELKIKIAHEQKRQREEYICPWKEKVRHVVKKFQEFVAYSLHNLPEYGEFFINAEKLMLLHMNSAIEDPNTESIFEEDVEEESTTSAPAPEPFVVFGDLKTDIFKKEIQKKLCPDRCFCPLLPVLMINKRCIYAGCDNFQVFRDKIKAFIDGKRGDDNDFANEKITVDAERQPSKDVYKSTVESSMTRLLKKEQQSDKPICCKCLCRLDVCFCSPPHLSDISLPLYRQDPPPSLVRIPSGNKITTEEARTHHRREPTLEKFVKSVVPNKCDCANRLRKGLKEHMPPYMIKTSKYQSLAIPSYEPCSIATLKDIVEKLRGTPPKTSKLTPTDIKIEAATQCQNRISCRLCSNAKTTGLREELRAFDDLPQFKLVGEHSPTKGSDYLFEKKDTFAMKRVRSLRQLLISYPSLKSLLDVHDNKVNPK